MRTFDDHIFGPVYFLQFIHNETKIQIQFSD